MEGDEFTVLEPEIEAIADEMDLPMTTATTLHRNIGDLHEVKQKLGNAGPEEYIQSLRQREWLMEERSQIVSQWTSVLMEWILSQAERPTLIHNPELHEEYQKKRNQVVYEMRRVDQDWIGVTQELRGVENDLVNIFRTHFETRDVPFEKKKHKIIELKTRFPYLRSNKELVARAADCSQSYAEKFKHIPGEGIASRRVKGKLRKGVLERDDHSCVCCGEGSDIVVHHIIPRGSGGVNSKENLATLCEDCHYYAHGGGKQREGNLTSTADWDSVEYENREEFWDEWIHRDFQNRGRPGVARSDFN